jgi:ATP-binding cassette subfamily B protein
MFAWFKRFVLPVPGGDYSLIRRLLIDLGYPHRMGYGLSFLLMGVAAACTALTAYLIGAVVNQAYLNRNMAGLVALAVTVIIVFSLKGIATYSQSVLIAKIGNRIVAENQFRMFQKLLTAGLEYFAEKHSSEFLMKVTQGAIAATSVLNLLINALGRDALTLIGLIIVMVSQDPILSVVGFLAMPPAIIFLRRLMKRTKDIAMREFVGGVRILQTVQETIQGLRIVKAFTLEKEMEARIGNSIRSVEIASNKMARVANRSTPLMESLGGIVIALVLLYGGYGVLVLNASPGQFISFITAFLLAYEPAKRLARLNVELSSQLIVVKMLFDTLDMEGTEPEEPDETKLIARGHIRFRSVDFSYRPGEPVLRDVSFNVEPGKLTALVGPSGGGKSTVLSLILRFYTQTGGTIEIDGVDIRTMSRRSLRRQIAYVGQDVFLFSGSVRENIRYGKLSASDDEIYSAASAAHAHKFIVALPQGYDTEVGEGGSLLSVGQRQRIAVARAFIRNAPIILLDEATSSLDSESEREVQTAVSKLRTGRTCLAIAHRLNTITAADCIYVLESGVVAESGTHDELLHRNGRYATFYQIQFGKHATAIAVD